MVNAVEILRSGGNLRPEQTVQAAEAEGVEIAVAAAILQKESYGGKNVWGSDGVSTGGTYTKGGAVTQANYVAYRTAMRAGRIGRQGVGPCQCTSAQYQDVADQLGGCWDPVANMRSGFRGMGALIERYGVQQGARRYNGSGAAAEAYGADFQAKYDAWVARLAGASSSGVATGPDTLPELTHGMRGDFRVASLQRFLNAHRWVPALPLLPVTGNYLDKTAEVLAAAQRQMGIRGGDGRNTGPQTRAALWARGWRG